MHCTDCNFPVKPGISFFGETLPQRFKEKRQNDFDNCDLLIVLGTSLSVAPFRTLVLDYVAPSTPRVLINLTYVPLPNDLSWNLHLQMKTDLAVDNLVRDLNMEHDFTTFANQLQARL